MSLLSAVIVAILFSCISDASASVISNEKTVEYENSKTFKVYVMEEATKYVEKISVDEENDLEYFHVPAHNGLTEADYLYDFRSNISVRREDSKASCYLGPLPDDVPKPSDLKTGLQRENKAPSKDEAQKFWVVSEEVDKTLLRQEVQDFCDQFPVFRMKEVDLRSAAAGLKGNVERRRFARRMNFPFIPLCDRNFLPNIRCNPNTWLYSFKFNDCRGTWWVRDCKFGLAGQIQCKCMTEDWNQLGNKMVCYTIRCP